MTPVHLALSVALLSAVAAPAKAGDGSRYGGRDFVSPAPGALTILAEIPPVSGLFSSPVTPLTEIPPATAPPAIPATANEFTPMSGAEFDAYVTGKTIIYAENGLPYGVEEYLPGRRVRWAFTDSACQDGIWFARDEQICFDYGTESGTQCWQFFRIGDGLRAEYRGIGGLEVFEAWQSSAPMSCPGPDVGV
jgi:hypothetical protein